uniref:Putative secreted protein n=1 Tax=Anopheles marajoara TaxID=58244 RepID=A0A2M4C5X4_9DIPT
MFWSGPGLVLAAAAAAATPASTRNDGGGRHPHTQIQPPVRAPVGREMRNSLRCWQPNSSIPDHPKMGVTSERQICSYVRVRVCVPVDAVSVQLASRPRLAYDVCLYSWTGPGRRRVESCDRVLPSPSTSFPLSRSSRAWESWYRARSIHRRGLRRRLQELRAPDEIETRRGISPTDGRPHLQ